jgi:hypothetical protein
MYIGFGQSLADTEWLFFFNNPSVIHFWADFALVENVRYNPAVSCSSTVIGWDVFGAFWLVQTAGKPFDSRGHTMQHWGATLPEFSPSVERTLSVVERRWASLSVVERRSSSERCYSNVAEDQVLLLRCAMLHRMSREEFVWKTLKNLRSVTDVCLDVIVMVPCHWWAVISRSLWLVERIISIIGVPCLGIFFTCTHAKSTLLLRRGAQRCIVCLHLSFPLTRLDWTSLLF